MGSLLGPYWKQVFWHIAEPGYQPGSDLLTFDERVKRGQINKKNWKWRGGLDDGAAVVSLWDNPFHALAHLTTEEVSPGSKILRVSLPPDYPGLEPELDEDRPHPVVRGSVPAKHIQVISSEELVADARRLDDSVMGSMLIHNYELFRRARKKR